MILSQISNVAGLNISAERIEALKAAFVALCLGAGLVYLSGFSSAEATHNAAHDTRHSLSFPCH
jgi:cobalt transporter subunit CbtB